MATDFFQTIEYPASKLDVINVAVERGAPQELVEALQRSRRERFENRREVEVALATQPRER